MKVTLSSGIVVDVQPVPPIAMLNIRARHAGEDNADQLLNESALLLGLPGIEVPEDWSMPAGLLHAGIKSRDGEYGHVLDYIEYGLIKTSRDLERLRSAMYDDPDNEEITNKEIEDSVATFRS